MDYKLILSDLRNFFTSAEVMAAGRALVVTILGVVFSRTLPRLLPVGRLHPQHQLVLRRSFRYIIFLSSIGWALSLLGVSLQLLLGAAGILTVAVGFASQTSASNLISGLFLMAEQPFRIGDMIKMGEITGTIVSIELLSFRLRTFDNVEIRIPNETMIKSNVTNLTKYPIRRYDLPIAVAYHTNLSKIRTLFQSVLDEIPLAMVDPKPQMIFLGFEDSGIKLQFSVWCTRENFFPLKTQLSEKLKAAFDANGIEIPFPHISLYAGSQTAPFPVTMVEPAAHEAAPSPTDPPRQ
ncbi:mechanosensitive ion channel family protein [Myxococcota bacterium]|nr:mechanosensitive ion channel family protein [Myxococcota bacterium]MBU1534159.1 mechanosensitive ion channel family protein [Myxococcota bacterium]